MKINVNKSESQNLLDLINKGKSTALTLDDVEFGVPRAEGSSPFEKDDPNKKPIKYNTVVKVTAKSSSTKYKESADFKWRRLDIGNQWLLNTGSYDVKYDDNTFVTFNDDNIKSYINERISLIPSSIIYNVSISGETATATLTSKANSLCYIGTLVINISKKDAEKIPVSTIIVDPDTGNGFEYELSKEVASVVNGRGFIYSGKPSSD